MMYDNKFFKTVEEAKAYKRENKCGGVLIELKPRCRKNTRRWFEYEMAVAYDARGERVNPEETPVCLAWNIPLYDQELILIEA